MYLVRCLLISDQPLVSMEIRVEGEETYELTPPLEAFRCWARTQPSLPRAVEGCTALYHAFKQGWQMEEAQQEAEL